MELLACSTRLSAVTSEETDVECEDVAQEEMLEQNGKQHSGKRCTADQTWAELERSIREVKVEMQRLTVEASQGYC